MMRPAFGIAVLFSAVLIANTVFGSMVNNEISGTPKVECHNDVVTLDITTKNPFSGNVFVKGQSKDPACSQEFDQNRASYTSYTLQLGRCGMQRLRSANPRGMNFMITVIVSFHPIFITMRDKAYHIKCFYMEPEEFVTANLEVSMLPTTALYDSMAMPTCSYSVRRNSPDGPAVTFANVGDTVYHVWECVGPDMGIMVKKCYVNDGRGHEVAVLDYNGCVLDSILLDDLTYDSSLMRAYSMSMVFKYADESQLFFTCQIRLCQKALGLCQGISPPRCISNRTRREVNHPQLSFRNVYTAEQENVSNSHQTTLDNPENPTDPTKLELPEIDVLSPEVTVMDLDNPLHQTWNLVEKDSSDKSTTISNIASRTRSQDDSHKNMLIRGIPESFFESFVPAPPSEEGQNLCLSPLVVALVCAAIISVAVLSAVVSVFVYKTWLFGKSLKLWKGGCSSSSAGSIDGSVESSSVSDTGSMGRLTPYTNLNFSESAFRI